MVRCWGHVQLGIVQEAHAREPIEFGETWVGVVALEDIRIEVIPIEVRGFEVVRIEVCRTEVGGQVGWKCS